MLYRFILIPERDACKRCIKDAYADGIQYGLYNIHEVNSRSENVIFERSTGELTFPKRAGEGRTGIIHRMCRCHAFVIEAVDDAQALDKDSTPLQGRVVYQRTGEDEANSGKERQVRQTLRKTPLDVHKSPGETFGKVVSSVVTSIYNTVFKLFKWKKDK